MKRNKFSLSHYRLQSQNFGDLVPIGCYEVLPGDTVQQNTSVLLRCSPMLAPVMHPVHLRIHHWYVPTRLIWEDFEDFITGGADGDDASVPPYWSYSGFPVAAGSLDNYLGVPVGYEGQVRVLPFRAYNLIFNEWYRDQDLVTEASISLASGQDDTTENTLRRAAWEKDYFTSARPWEQKGSAVTIPLTGDAPVLGIGVRDGGAAQADNANTWRDSNGVLHNSASEYNSEAVAAALLNSGTIGASNYPNIYADLSAVAGVTVNDLREALALQRFQEARARYGSRYTEYLRYLGVMPQDARLQRPEYLGGGKQTIQFSEVLQTGPDASDDQGVGRLKGHGIAAMRTNRFRRFIPEHGFVISLMTVRPKAIYADGLGKMWSRAVKEDYWQRELEHIGQAEVLNKEVYSQHATPDGVFGYQDRYDEYRRLQSFVAGEFAESTLDFWHLARLFGSDPALNSTFVECNPEPRPFAVPSEDLFYVMANHSIQARRMVAKQGNSYIY